MDVEATRLRTPMGREIGINHSGPCSRQNPDFRTPQSRAPVKYDVFHLHKQSQAALIARGRSIEAVLVKNK
jgi:hypothetical protein